MIVIKLLILRLLKLLIFLDVECSKSGLEDAAFAYSGYESDDYVSASSGKSLYLPWQA